MIDQYFGTAPCGCRRDADYLRNLVCADHGAVWAGKALLCAWDAAQAIEQGLRAIAGWPTDLQRLNDQLAYSKREHDAAMERAREMYGDTERSADTMAAAFGLDAAERNELKGALVGIRKSLDALSGDTERPPAPRTTCYYDGEELPCSEHPNQPPQG